LQQSAQFKLIEILIDRCGSSAYIVALTEKNGHEKSAVHVFKSWCLHKVW